MTQENWEKNEITSDFVKFNKVGDYIQGTLMDKYKPDKPDKYGKIAEKYVVKATEGKWHAPDGEEFEANVGENYRVGSNPVMEKAMKSSVIGQKIRFKLTELRKNNKGNPTKIIEAFSLKDAEGRPILDQDALAEVSTTHDEIDPDNISM